MPPAPAPDRRFGGGCGIALAVLAAVLVGGFLALDKSIDWMVERAREKVTAAIPAELAGPRRARLAARLERLVGSLPDAGRERERLTGEFLGRAGEILEDRRMTVDEAEALEAWLSEALAEPSEAGGSERAP